jgi:peptidyl-dipeptidase A
MPRRAACCCIAGFPGCARARLAAAGLLIVALANVARAAPEAAPRTGPAGRATTTEREAQAFLESFSALSRPVARAAALAAWKAATDMTPEHAAESAGAAQTAAALQGSSPVIDRARALLAREKQLRPLTVRMLRRLLLDAAASPGTMPDLVVERVEAEARQSRLLDLHRGPEIDRLLRTSDDIARRAETWNASKEVGRALKPELVNLVRLRNQIARGLGHSSFFALEVADYGMSVREMMALLDGTLQAIAPLQAGLSCWVRHTLAARWKQPVPAALPAHWLGNRWGHTWPIQVPQLRPQPAAPSPSPPPSLSWSGRSAESIVRSAEEFYVALGFPRLPPSFWRRSDLYPAPPGSGRKKATQAATFYIDGVGADVDVRAIMNVEPTRSWFHTAHHELGHVHYLLAYTRPEIPPLLRGGANRAFPEAMAELGRLASEQPPYLRRLGLLPAGTAGEPIEALLAEALESLALIPFAAGTMAHFEHDLYEAELPAAAWQSRWWQYVARYQGVDPPAPRPADLCDACTKPQISEHPARYHDYALATLIKYQLHDHICRKILKQDVHACDYAGSAEVGAFLRSILSSGATVDWRELMEKKTGEPLGPRALVGFFAPLGPELTRRNQGRCP